MAEETTENEVEQTETVAKAKEERSIFNHRIRTIGGFIDEGLLDGKSANVIISEWEALAEGNKTTVGRVNAQAKHLNAAHGMAIVINKTNDDTTYVVEDGVEEAPVEDGVEEAPEIQ